LVERDLAKVEVAGSKPVSRSTQTPRFVFKIGAPRRTKTHQNAGLLGSATGVKLSGPKTERARKLRPSPLIAAAMVHSEPLRKRSSITLAACLLIRAVTWPYTSRVKPTDEWRSISLTVFASTRALIGASLPCVGPRARRAGQADCDR
jgi:hypothetical protein